MNCTAKRRQWFQRFNYLRSNLITIIIFFSKTSISTGIPKGPALAPSETLGGKSSHPTNCVGVQLALNFLFFYDRNSYSVGIKMKTQGM
jgi:hypothetical protein